MSDLMKVGSDFGVGGTFKPLTSGTSGAQRVNDAHGRYMSAVTENRVFHLSVTAAGPSGYTGAAGGTPLIAVHNPANSGKLAALLMVGYSNSGHVTAAGTSALNVWSGPSVLPTGTVTRARSALGLAQGGGMVCFANTALTGSTALTLALPLMMFHIIGATPVSESHAPTMYDIGGIVIAAPGNQFAIGLNDTLTGLSCNLAVYWEELPYLPLV